MAKRKSTQSTVLTKLSIDMDWVKTSLSNHLAHHWAAEIAIGGAVVIEAIALIFFLVKGHISLT
jgi:hypothetical protein